MSDAEPLDLDLPEHLRERIARRSGPVCAGRGEFVVYWMRTAARGHENPALDVARVAAAALEIPVLVYHAVSERYPYASDRLHAFALQGAVDVAHELAELGVVYALHVERPGHRGPHLRQLAERAALVVTEELPVPPLRVWTRRLVEHVDTPVWTVDSACVVPMPLVGRRPERAYAFRDATRRLRDERLRREWPALDLPADPAAGDDPAARFALPFEPVDPATLDLEELLAACAIDHTVPPVPDTRGGPLAGYARWQAFLARIVGYSRSRNDPLRDGVSRMSAWLHWGHVSPLRIAREAALQDGDGAAKYLDELLVWRELAYAWCFHTRDVHDPECLPTWARNTLREHEADPRPLLPSWETLAHGRTGDVLWDACQRSLLRHGELHNNLRMTWGKALVSWTGDVEQAMERLADLNHRYALDGRDPASYGGLWWCLGLFDRPFQPEQRILGSVRPRPTREHARRLDVDRYAERVDRPRHAPLRFQLGMGTVSTAKVAVVGAGLSGLACAGALRAQGLRVDVFDKARGYGGRTSTRRIEDGAVSVDHGAQYFTARDPRFRTRVDSWIEDGVVAEWDARVVTLHDGRVGPDPRPGSRLVGTPGMSALCRHLGAGVGEVRFGVRVLSVARLDGCWRLDTERDGAVDGYDFLVVALPAPQAAELLADADREAASFAAAVPMTPCLASWLVFETPFDVPFDAAFCEAGDDLGRPLAWAARNSSKPGRDPHREVWVLHGTPAWSAELLEEEPAAAVLVLAEALARESGRTLPRILAQGAHRWRYALPPEPAAEDHRFDAANGLALCGDWCGGPRVEGAWLSGSAAAGAVLRHLNLRAPS